MKRLLIIEDSKTFLNMVLRQLNAEFPQLVLDTAESWAEAQAAIESTSKDYELVITDLVLPDSQGEHVPVLVKRGCRVLVMTAKEDEQTAKHFTRMMILDFIVKTESYALEYLSYLVRRLLNNEGKKVLVVEDSSAMRHYFVSLLKLQNFEVVEAGDGQEALEKLSEELACVITDYDMPRKNGLDLLRTVRKQFSSVQMPVIGISSSDSSIVATRFLKVGANDYLSKPFSQSELICRLNNILEWVETTRRIEALATTDQLTQLKNRNYFYQIVPTMVENASRYGHPLSLVMLDIDHFKSFNDTYGHDVGDIVLRHVAQLLIESVRKSDITVRYGGEEMLVVMPHTDLSGALEAAEKIRRALEQSSIKVEGASDTLKVTASFGVAQFQEGESLDEWMKHADEALYEAKRSGRNRVVAADAGTVGAQ